jgi:hypothetical protein
METALLGLVIRQLHRTSNAAACCYQPATGLLPACYRPATLPQHTANVLRPATTPTAAFSAGLPAAQHDAYPLQRTRLACICRCLVEPNTVPRRPSLLSPPARLGISQALRLLMLMLVLVLMLTPTLTPTTALLPPHASPHKSTPAQTPNLRRTSLLPSAHSYSSVCPSTFVLGSANQGPPPAARMLVFGGSDAQV